MWNGFEESLPIKCTPGGPNHVRFCPGFIQEHKTLGKELQPTSNVHYFERATVYRERGEYELALAGIEKGFQIDSIKDASWFTRAQAFSLSGDIYFNDLKQYGKAIEQYSKAIELEPSNVDYRAKRDEATTAINATTEAPDKASSANVR